MTCRILEVLGVRRLVVRCPYGWVGILIASEAALRAARRRGGVVVFHDGRFRADLLFSVAEARGLREVLDKVYVATSLPIPSRIPVVVYGLEGLGMETLYGLLDRVVLVVADKVGRLPRILRATSVRVSRISENRYKLTWSQGTCVVKATSRGLVEEELGGLLAKALSILMQATVEFGPLSQRDAVDVLCRRLSMKRGEARKILVELARRGYIGVEGGQVNVY